MVAEVPADAGLPPANLVIEVTESTVMRDARDAIEVLSQPAPERDPDRDR